MANPALVVAAPAKRSMRWSVLGLLTVGIIIAYVDRINLSSALPEMRKSFRLTPEASGILLAAVSASDAGRQSPAASCINCYGMNGPVAIACFGRGLAPVTTG